MKRYLAFIYCILLCGMTFAQGDSIIIYKGNSPEFLVPTKTPISTSEFNRNRLHHSFCLAVPIATVGLALMPADEPVSNRIQSSLPTFNTKVDDYLRFAPLVAQVSMSLGGVKGRSESRWQVLATDALATTMMVGMTGGMKYIINRPRPNGEEHSFPSGHTATAFMGATLLAHEYGHKSVWIPIAGYSVATATGVLRVLNNDHYISDVVVGAAIGILSAELAYWASDAIFNNKKLFKSRRARMHYEVLKNY